MSDRRIIIVLSICSLVVSILRLHHESLIASLIVYLAQEFKATLMHSLDLLHGQVKVDTQYHDLVALDAHNDREYHESTHHHEHAEEYEC
jgi:hypothetical protein